MQSEKSGSTFLFWSNCCPSVLCYPWHEKHTGIVVNAIINNQVPVPPRFRRNVLISVQICVHRVEVRPVQSQVERVQAKWKGPGHLTKGPCQKEKVLTKWNGSMSTARAKANLKCQSEMDRVRLKWKGPRQMERVQSKIRTPRPNGVFRRNGKANCGL